MDMTPQQGIVKPRSPRVLFVPRDKTLLSAFLGGAEPKDGAGAKDTLWDGRRPLQRVQHMKKPPQMEQNISPAKPGRRNRDTKKCILQTLC
ncbi:hypothetical protein DV515_00018117 [Chloebia gouldiae]|uniref:Uncharacterized protein n=1 Tax=Chloebia gouldiae TaxID=44316 RepID=A0A3L8Q998_CHLGU|nr:hypothetical protein DV515_00018117 [Chloebia gouldiae]